MNLDFFGEIADLKGTLSRYISEIEARYQSRIGEFLSLKDELYTLRNVLQSQGLKKDSALANQYLTRCSELIEEQLELERIAVNVISQVSELKKSELYNRIMNPTGDMLNDAAFYIQAAQLVRDSGNLLANWNDINQRLINQVSNVKSFSDEVRDWLGLPRNIISAFPFNMLILPAGIIVGFAVLGSIIGKAVRSRK